MQQTTDVQRLSTRVAGLKPSGIRKFFDIAATMKDVISLGIGEPDFTTPKPILEAGIRSLQNGETHYTSNHGKLEVRQAVANNLQHLYGVSYDPASEVIITVGVSEALYLTMTALLNPGDEVIIPTPCFVSYQAEVILAGGVPVEIPARIENNFMVDPADIRNAITPRTKIIFIGYPSNPTGAVATLEVILEIGVVLDEPWVLANRGNDFELGIHLAGHVVGQREATRQARLSGTKPYVGALVDIATVVFRDMTRKNQVRAVSGALRRQLDSITLVGQRLDDQR